MSASDDYILELLDIDKRFPGVQALQGVDFRLKKGEVHALVGENGAGKSTLMKIIMGIYTKDNGRTFLDGKKFDIRTPEEAHDMGIGMIFQELSLIPQLNVAQNIFLGNEPLRRLHFLNNRQLYSRAWDLVEKYNIGEHFRLKDRVMNLSRGYSQIVEVLKALSRDTKVLIMDEPTASLTKEEEDTLYQIIMNLKSRGVSIIYISHRLEEIFRNCDRVTVLRDGKRVSTKRVSDVTMEGLIEMMTGKKIETTFHHGRGEGGVAGDGENILLKVRGLCWQHHLKDVDFHVNYGEVIGVTGLMGSGKSEIARALFGIDVCDSGSIFIEGEEIQIESPSDAVNLGLALVPEDRRYEGLVLMQSVEENVSLPLVGDLTSWGWFQRKSARERVKIQVDQLDIKTPSLKQKTEYLSGGNQQKVVVAKWLTKKPKLLILDEPTVGIDVNTKAELRDLIREMVKDKSCGVLLFSSDLNEIIQVSDRIIVLYRGEVIKEYSNLVPMKEEILHRTIQGIIME